MFRQEVKIGSALGKLLMRTARMLQGIAGHKAIPDIQKAAEVDVRPNIRGDFEVKFKPEVLPLKDGLGGMRTLFSHNVEFALSALEEGEHESLEAIVHMLPALSSIKRAPGEKVNLVADIIVEEILQDIGTGRFVGLRSPSRHYPG